MTMQIQLQRHCRDGAARWIARRTRRITPITHRRHLPCRRYGRRVVVRWLNRDPIGQEGFKLQYSSRERLESARPNPYTFVLNNPIASIDPTGLDRWSVFQVHWSIIVEEWDENCKTVVGYQQIDFGPRWGWGALVGIPTLGAYIPGQVTITPTTKPSGWNVSPISSTCEADKILLNWARDMQKNPPCYNLYFFHCGHFSAIAQNVGIGFGQ